MAYTTKGHRLEFVPPGDWSLAAGLTFRCHSRALGQHVIEGRLATSQTDWISSDITVWFPCTQNQMVAIVAAWVSAYQDEELASYVPKAVATAFDLVPLPPPVRDARDTVSN